MHKAPIGATFIAASKKCNRKPLSDTIYKVFITILNTVGSFHNKGFLHWGCKKFWVVLSSILIAIKLNKINVKKKIKSIATFDFSTVYKTILHKLLQKVLSKIINFVLKSKVIKRNRFPKTSIYWTYKVEDTSLSKLLSGLGSSCQIFLLINIYVSLL